MLYDRYLHMVFGLCMKYFKDRDVSKDATMDIYELLVKKLANHEVQHFKSWLYMVSKNHCLMILRKNTPEIKNGDFFMENELPVHPVEEQSLEQDLSALEDCINTLKTEQQLCVREFYLEQKSYQEIASAHALEMMKVKSHIQNGKRNLKICIESKHVSA